MILGLSTPVFTWVHVVLSLIGMVSGAVVVLGMFGAKKLSGWTALFLVTTILTSVTGFLFPFTKFEPSHAVGILSLAVLAIALLALYVQRLEGPWRWIYVAGAVVALYFNVFVGVVQAFQKLSPLKPLAPTQSEPPFLIAQVIVLGIFIALGVAAARLFHPDSETPTVRL